MKKEVTPVHIGDVMCDVGVGPLGGAIDDVSVILVVTSYMLLCVPCG